MPPERAAGAPPCIRADVHQLANLFVKLVT